MDTGGVWWLVVGRVCVMALGAFSPKGGGVKDAVQLS